MYPEHPVAEEKFHSENILAEEAISTGNLPEAARILVPIVEKDPQNWRALNNIGIISWAQKCWKDAYAMFTRSVVVNPTYTDALVNLFDASIKLQCVNDVLPLFEKALEINPDLEEIRAIRDTIIELGPDIYNSTRAHSIGVYSELIEEAEQELEAGNLFSAMDKFLKANDQEGPSAKGFCGLGIISFYQKRFQDAFSLFYESIKLNPIDADTYLNLLDAAKECGQVAEAIKIFRFYCKEFPSLEKIAPQFENQE